LQHVAGREFPGLLIFYLGSVAVWSVRLDGAVFAKISEFYRAISTVRNRLDPRIPCGQRKGQAIFADRAQLGDSGADWRSRFKGLRQITYAAGGGKLLTGAGKFFHPGREFIVRSRECPYSAGFVESIYSRTSFGSYVLVL
jgi:hypothetical protein